LPEIDKPLLQLAHEVGKNSQKMAQADNAVQGGTLVTGPGEPVTNSDVVQ